MGTSTASNGTSGSGTPLTPTWLEPVDQLPSVSAPINPSVEPDSDTEQADSLPPVPPPADPQRYRQARTEFSQYIKSGGRDKSLLGKSLSNYITRSAGGARSAARSMGSSRTSSANLARFLSDVAQNGLESTLNTLNLAGLVGRPVEEIFAGLVDYICPSEGTVDAGKAREAFIETIVELAKNGISDLDNLSLEQIQVVFEIYVSNAIENRIYNEIGTNLMTFSQDIETVDLVQSQLQDFVRNSVSDAMDGLLTSFEDLTPKRVLGFVDDVYEQAFLVLGSLASAESETS